LILLCEIVICEGVVCCYWRRLVLCSSRLMGLRKRVDNLVATERYHYHYSDIKRTTAQRYLDCNSV